MNVSTSKWGVRKVKVMDSSFYGTPAFKHTRCDHRKPLTASGEGSMFADVLSICVE